jgi:enoyl-CoA hydratase
MTASQAAPGTMTATVDGAIGWMAFDNPDKRNAVSAAMWEAIPALFDRFEADPAVRVIVLRGAGDKAFVAGLDISQFEEKFSAEEVQKRHSALTAAAQARIAGAAKPTIAMINGFCIGAGVQIAANCDLRIAADTAKLAVTAAKMGLGYPPQGVKRLLDLIGPARVHDLFFTARQIAAAEARDMGLVNQVVAAAELEAAVRATAETVAANAPLSIKAVRDMVREFQKAPGNVDRKVLEAVNRACLTSSDYAEGRRAFTEKRKPVFTGK